MQIIRVRLVNSEEALGCEKSPIEIIKELKKINFNEKNRKIEFEKLNLEEIHVDLDNIEEANHLIFENSKIAFERNFKSFFIGGDHSITYSIGRALNKKEENPLLIVFDAHCDCNENSNEYGNKKWLMNLIESGFNGEKIILIGTRSFSEDEINFLKENKVNMIKMEILNEGIEEVCDLMMERARNSSGFYVSIDIDCVDPAFAPATNSIEPGGISSRDMIYFAKRLSLLDNLRGGDIVEVNPERDFNNMTVRLGAKILSELI